MTLYSRPRSSFRAVPLGLDGAPLGKPQEFGFGYGVGGYGLIPAGAHARLVFATYGSYIEHRICPNQPGPHAPPARRHRHERRRGR